MITSPALTCVCGVAACPLTEVMTFDVLSVGDVGLFGLHALQVPTVEVTRFAICEVPGGSGVLTVSV